MKKKLLEKCGIALAVVLMSLLVMVTFLLVILVPGYKRHLQEARLTMDSASVDTARDVACIRYLQDGATGLKIYYYDEANHSCIDRDGIDQIEAYGRSSKQQNEKEETGARGIPNLGKDGPQLLAVAVSDQNILNIRWTGKAWRYLDYYYMFPAERKTLTASILRAMDSDTEMRARSAALNQYDKDYKDQLKRNRDPGTAVYDYSAVNDFVYYDECMTKGGDYARIPEKMNPGSVDNLLSYGLADECENKVVQVTIAESGKSIDTRWLEGDQG